jgi:hypothetical protein
MWLDGLDNYLEVSYSYNLGSLTLSPDQTPLRLPASILSTASDITVCLSHSRSVRLTLSPLSCFIHATEVFLVKILCPTEAPGNIFKSWNIRFKPMHHKWYVLCAYIHFFSQWSLQWYEREEGQRAVAPCWRTDARGTTGWDLLPMDEAVEWKSKSVHPLFVVFYRLSICRWEHPHFNRESVFRGMQLCCVLLITFPPSKNFETYLFSYMQQKTTQQEGRVNIMAKYCLWRLAFITKKGPRGKLPSIAKIETASVSACSPRLPLYEWISNVSFY